jgi:hypothetical protein
MCLDDLSRGIKTGGLYVPGVIGWAPAHRINDLLERPCGGLEPALWLYLVD